LRATPRRISSSWSSNYGIAWHEKTLGQLFCDGSAKQIVAMLLDQCEQGGVELRLGHAASEIGHADGMFQHGAWRALGLGAEIVIATGGPSIPKMGATALRMTSRGDSGEADRTTPGAGPADPGRRRRVVRDLSGVATEVVASAGQGRFREAALFTHRGLSGPAILQVSSYWRHGEAVVIDFLPDRDAGWLIAEKRVRPRATLRSILGQALPDRLAER